VARPVLPVRLVALDLDGTLLGPDLPIRPRVRRAIQAARGAGVPLVIATGRMYRSALRYASALALDGPLICYQGGYVREMPAADGRPGSLLYERPMTAQVAREAIRWARHEGLDPHLNLEDRLLMEMGDEGAEDYERSSGIGAEFVPDLLAAVRGRPTKILAVGPRGLPERLLERARRDFDGRAQVTVSHPEFLEWTATDVHKGRAVRWLARRMAIPLGQVMAVGDQHNDIEMLAAVGHGVAMGGAPEAVRHAARYLTLGWHEDGAALAIEALVLGKGSLEDAA
jgi:Cof subfamily protein (haloacid dehalogenase superfamily)